MKTLNSLKSNYWSNGTVEVLTKEEQRKIIGGITCTYHVSFSNGTNYSITGECGSNSQSECEKWADSQGKAKKTASGGSSYGSTCY